MSRDIYPTMTAATATLEKLNSVANNLSNLNTTGFRARRTVFENHLASQGHLGASFVKLSEPEMSKRAGSIIQDNVDTHFAIKGDGFFAVESHQGETLLARAGNFQLDSQGFLVNSAGEKVIGTVGHIQFDQWNRDFSVSKDGSILDVNGQEINRFVIMNANEMSPLNNSRYTAEDPYTMNGNFEVIQGSIEVSNVDPFREMLEMITTSRAFETYQKSMSTSREMDGQVIQSARRS